jgi:RecJ-like exonuclease
MKRSLAVFLAVLVVSSFLGCSSEKYGKGVDRTITAVKVKDIFLDTNAAGKKVTVEGTVSTQCASSGCWFVLQDDTGQVFINLAPNNMTLPARLDRTARVTGMVARVQGELQVVAEGVEIR